jgi:S1-C subfamily serine protease
MQNRREWLSRAIFGSTALLAEARLPLEVRAQVQHNAAEAADRARTKVVILKTLRGATRGSATGFLVRSGQVLTAGHVAAPGTKILAWLNGVPYPTEVAATHSEHDLALLTLRAPSLLLKPVDLAATSVDLAPDEPAVILTGPSQPRDARGEPTARLPLPARFLQRRVIRDADGRNSTVLAFRGQVRKGDSGSPVLRARDGRVIGVLCSRELPDAEGVSRTAYAVPIEALQLWLGMLPLPEQPDEEFYLDRVRRGKV